MVVILRYDKYIHCAQLYVVWLKCDNSLQFDVDGDKNQTGVPYEYAIA